jgi:hypothetical protein
MNIRQYVIDLELPTGHSVRTDCPKCHRKNTFGASNDMGVLKWQCFSASCGTRGIGETNLSAADIRALMNRVDIKETIEPIQFPMSVTRSLPEEAISWLKYWGIYTVSSYYWDIKDSRVVFPIIKNHILYDATGRTLNKVVTPKWKRYGGSGLPYVVGAGTVAVVVEDAISAAVCASEGYVGVALLGTSLMESHALALNQYDKVIVALDPDASMKSLAHVKELRRHIRKAVALKLDDDIKYRLDVDLDKLRSMADG